MTNDLFRKEAIEHRRRSLYGNIILQSPPGLWVTLFLLIIVVFGLTALLVWGRVITDDGSLSLLQWLMRQSQP